MDGLAGSRQPRLGDYRHLALDDTVSTNSDCLERARSGDPGLLWITARRQRGGRGRRGRAWVSEAGNLYASLLLINPAPFERLSSLPLAVAVALRRAVADVMPNEGRPVEVKWPNDVMIGRKKTSGILIESERLANGDLALVIGCGINIVHRPDNPLYPATSLNEEGASVTPELLFDRLFIRIAEVLAIWNGGHGIAAIVAEWRDHAMGIGEAITVNLADRSIPGTFAGIDDLGILQLATTAGDIIPIAAGDVFFN